MALEDSARCVIDVGPVCFPLLKNARVTCEIERTLREGGNAPHIEYNKDKIEGYKLEVQEILAALNAPGSPLDENLSVGECALRLVHGTAATSASGSGTSLAPPSSILYGILIAP
jgi:hypothetical protein